MGSSPVGVGVAFLEDLCHCGGGVFSMLKPCPVSLPVACRSRSKKSQLLQ